MFKKRSLASEITVLAASTLFASCHVLAENWAIEEVLVTAQKRSESVQDVPVSISAFNNEMLTNTGADEIGDILLMIPGLSGTTPAGGLNFWSIRGIASTDFTVGGEPSVGVFVNDAYIGRNIHATSAFHDVERIEVVKGPQGTLFGRNAAAGAISIITNKPGNDNTARIGVGVGDEGQRELDLVGNLALSDDFAIRGSYHGTRLEGVQEEVVQGDKGSIDKDALRLSARWNVSETFKAILTFDYSEAKTRVLNGNYNPGLQVFNDTVTPGAGSTYPDKIGYSALNEENVQTDGVDLRLTWDISDNLTLTSITDVRSFETDYIYDFDGSQADSLLGAAFGLPPVSMQFDQPEITQESLSQEFRINGFTDSLDWFVGGSYYKEEVGEETVISILDTTGALGGNINDSSIVDGETESWGLYADVKWAITGKWALTAGIRWSQDEKDWCASGVNSSNLLGVIDTGGQEVCDNEKWNELTPRFVADYALAEDVMVYASFSKGYKGGGFNTPTRSTDYSNDLVLDLAGGFINTFDQSPYLGDISNVDPTTEQVFFTGEAVSSFDPETVDAYELGIKSAFLNNQLQFNAAAFFMDYQDLQIQSATTAGIITSNAAEAETQGIEVDFVYAATENLTLMGNYTYLDAEFQSGSNFAGADITGNTLPFAPENAYSLSGAYDLSVGEGTLSLFAAYNWMDDFSYRADNAPNLTEEAYGLWNAKLTYYPVSESWDIALGVDNINDKGYSIWKQDVGLGLGTNIARGMPRLMKLRFNVYF